MKLIIAGSRDLPPKKILSAIEEHIEQFGEITEVVSGTARGADKAGEVWAELNNIPVKKFPANWEQFGKSAGYKRNLEMAEYADAALVIWDGRSRGSKHMIDISKKYNLKLKVVIL